MKKSIGFGIFLGFLLAGLELYLWKFRFLSTSVLDMFLFVLIGGSLVLLSDWLKKWIERIYFLQSTMVVVSTMIGLFFVVYISYRSIQYSLVIYWLIWHFVEILLIFITNFLQKKRDTYEH
ncbi:hypothetical protein [Bulleidia sp. zg-1006]|uniref:hypothetical protein n=1 Tax=Bulleidia sp. zg-1006 TaxID=2806552 RepID=UPI00193A9DFC|nr:hypothetical protein [Bulleidia sp. zg-1006]QRG87005.1 hypothetical protein JOS54_01460 [Bulleidia sp. zg-1006]